MDVRMFKPNEYNISITKNDDTCEYCGCVTFTKRTHMSYKINDKYICDSCICKLSRTYNINIMKIFKDGVK